MKIKKIALTTKDNSKIWNNGLTQNALFLIQLLKKIGYDVVPVVESENFLETGKIGLFDIKILNKENIKNYDIIIEVSFSLTDELFEYAINNKIKIISINYGNVFAIAQENLILKPNESVALNREGGETWISPHFEYSKGFLEGMIKSEIKICPYIWSPEVFDNFCKKNNFNPFFNEKTNLKKIGIFESNINIIKTCIYPILGIEKLERKNKDIISSVMIFNAENLKENKKFKEIISNFDILNNKKLSAEARYPLPEIISRGYVGTIVSHHIYNDLNYLTLEAFHCNLPFIHNSKFCKDGGYYYDMFDAEMCALQIENAINNHNENLNNYKNKSAEILFKFSLENNENLNNYKYLIENISI